MRFLVPLLAMVMLGAPLPGHATETSESDASAIEQKLTYYLPAGIVSDGLIRIRPDGDHYRMTINPAALLTGTDGRVHITDIKPLDLALSQGADGLWTVKGHGALTVNADFVSSTGEKGSAVLVADDVDTKIVFDPAVGYPRDATVTLTGLNFSSTMSARTMSLKFGGLQLATSLENIRSGTADVSASVTAKATSFESGPVKVGVTIDDTRFETGFTTANLAGIRKIVTFILDGQKRSPTVMTAADQKALQDMVIGALPLASGFSQAAYVLQLNAEAAGNSGSIQAAKFSFAVPRDGDGTKIGLALVNLSLPPAMLPAPMAGLLPQKSSVETTIKGFHWAEALDYAFRNINMAENATAQQKLQFRKILAPDDRLVYSFENTWANSNLYNVDLSGWLSAPVDPTEHAPEMKMQIIATEVDTLSKYLFDRKDSVPSFKVAVGMLQAAKQMAKLDKTLLNWTVAFTPAEGLTVNGIDLSH